MRDALAESDLLVDELVAADVLVIGTPLYNFGMPAALKAWIDQVVRLGRTVGLDESNPTDPYVPLLADRPRHAVILTARGGIGFGPGEAMAHMNHLEPNLVTALGFIGITCIHQIAVEGQEIGGELLTASVVRAQREVDALVTELQAALAAASPTRRALPPGSPTASCPSSAIPKRAAYTSSTDRQDDWWIRMRDVVEAFDMGRAVR